MRYCMVLLMIMAGASSFAFADQTYDSPPAVVTWTNTDNYRDIEAVGEKQSRFEARVFEQLSQFFGKEAKKHLPPGQTLQIEVTNLDLAGDVRYRPNLSREMRVLDALTPPRLTFDYQILSEGKIIKQGTEKLSNINYQNSVIGLAKERPFAYEYQLIKNWAKKTL